MWQLVVLLYWQTLPVVPCCVLLVGALYFEGLHRKRSSLVRRIEPEGAAGSTSSSQQPHRFAESFSSLSSSSGIF
ncbi:hypothetical protein AMECASPLE_028254 [Ameca splendens]|uniref:Secreted protein n=1 Tax=Ameca splendens TaxID=208324 RepID=A0ABV0Z3X3_9TELE